ncbi:Prephenate dehydratase [Thamnocephalis sphaerospora]|uniref:prephenate dehydratase n=1 Tax=Thamnocephalis sphaerospora TaxID=78915 RepID=A0A4P9XWX3_9FUNG|nr:Prephenate dehydratase [Thamnocephalis sphaerospora]|eukprot:RKP10777.1 Prephenate dehydratase [Thamnocephalis sphaerospora]
MTSVIRIGFTGAVGSYSEAAVRALYAGHAAFKGCALETVSFETDHQLFEAVRSQKVDQAITPIENSLSGTLHEILSALIDTRDVPRLCIAAEFIFHEPHQLLGLPGATTSGARQVVSHDHVLAQCDEYLDAVLPKHNASGSGCQRVMVSSTGEAAELVRALNDKSVLCVAGHTAAAIYGLVPVAVDTDEQRAQQTRIETHADSSFTRFWLLAREDLVAPVERHQEPKTSLGLRTQNRPGALHRILSCFALRNINVYKIESRPQPRSILRPHAAWSYDMYIDFEGAPSVDASVARALDNVREFSTEVVVLGSYPRYVFDEQLW